MFIHNNYCWVKTYWNTMQHYPRLFDKKKFALYNLVSTLSSPFRQSVNVSTNCNQASSISQYELNENELFVLGNLWNLIWVCWNVHRLVKWTGKCWNQVVNWWKSIDKRCSYNYRNQLNTLNIAVISFWR